MAGTRVNHRRSREPLGAKRAFAFPIEKLMLLTAGLAIGLIGSELLARTSYWLLTKAKRTHLETFSAAPSDIPGVYFSLKPDGKDVNEDGFRYPPLARKKPEGTFRIFVLGDSMTYGVGVKRGQAYPNLLEKLLNMRGKGAYQVVNTGVPLYDIHQEESLLLGQLDRFDMDLVVLGFFGSNDLILSDWEKGSVSNGNAQFRALFSRQHDLKIPDMFPWLPEPIKSALIRDSYLYEYLCTGSFKILSGIPFLKGRMNGVRLQLVNELEAERALVDMINFLKRRGTHFLVVSLPWARYDREAPWDDDGRKWMLRMADKYEFPVLDMRPIFKAIKPELLQLPPSAEDNVHPGKYGHEVIARAILRFLQQHPTLIQEPVALRR